MSPNPGEPENTRKLAPIRARASHPDWGLAIRFRASCSGLNGLSTAQIDAHDGDRVEVQDSDMMMVMMVVVGI